MGSHNDQVVGYQVIGRIVFTVCLVTGLLSSGSAHAAAINGDQRHKLTANDPSVSALFGTSVAISGSRAIIGAESDDAKGQNSGSAYLFSVDTGQQMHKITANDGGAGDFFGKAVGISGDRAVVGASNDQAGAILSGSAYIFDASTGLQLHKLMPSDPAFRGFFGHSVAIHGNIAVVGSVGDDDAGDASGSAYLFDVTTGQQLHKLTASDPKENERFGESVAIDGNIAIVGASQDANTTGAAYLFDVTTGQQLHKLRASDRAGGDFFGFSVGISGNTAIVGAFGDAFGGRGDVGSAYLFDVTTGQEVHKIIADDHHGQDEFGFTVGISGDTAIIGAHRDDDAGEASGSAYLFNATTGQQVFKLTADDDASQDRFGQAVAIDGRHAIIGARHNADDGFNSGSAYLFDARIPEPTTLSLLAATTIPLLARRRRRA